MALSCSQLMKIEMSNNNILQFALSGRKEVFYLRLLQPFHFVCWQKKITNEFDNEILCGMRILSEFWTMGGSDGV